MLRDRSIPPTPSVPERKSSRDSRSPATDPPIFSQVNSAAAGSPAPNIADGFVEFAAPHNTRTSACTRARTPRNRTHTQPDHTSPVAQTSLSCGPRTTCRHTPARTSPRRTAPSVSLCSSLSHASARERRNSQRRARSRTRTMSHATVGAPRWPKASAWAAGRPQRGARGRPPRLDASRAGHPIPRRNGSAPRNP
jgi:hypothetical protein